MVKLKGIIDTINLLDKYNLDYDYDYDSNIYQISDTDYQMILNNSKNKTYIENLKVGKGSNFFTSGNRHATLASTEIQSGELLFTPAAILDLLLSIDEFSEFDFNISESLNGTLQLQVNDSLYDLESEELEIQVDDDVIDEVAQLNSDVYDELVDDSNIDLQTSIESGIIKETLKTLLIGGVVRLAKNYLTK